MRRTDNSFAQGNSKGFKNFGLLIIILIMCLPVYHAGAQTSILTPLSITAQQLNQEQTIRYNKVLAQNMHANYQFVRVEALAVAQLNGKIAVSFTNAPCPVTYFAAKNVEYFTNDSNYYWYGNLDYIDSSSDCSQGSAMILARNGEHFGQLEIENKTFELIELTGGVQLIAERDGAVMALTECGTSPGTMRTTDGMEPDGSSVCNVRLLILYTPAAAAQEPNIDNRITLAIAQTRQALLNSNVAHINLNIVHAGSHMIEYTEEPYTAKWAGTYIDVDNMTPFGPHNINAIISSARYAWQADVVVMLTRGNGGDNVAGRAFGIQDPDYPYAVVQSTYATNAGYTFAHELGHIFGARHQDNEDAASQDNTLSIAHAHKFDYSTSTGRSFWKKTHHYTAKTITYGATAGDADVVLQYSNPTVSYEGSATGAITSSYGRRFAAKQFNIVACDLAGYYADEPGNFFGGQISGISRLCEGRTATLYSKLFGAAPGAAGLCGYEWRKSTDGINFGPVIATTQNLSFTMPGLSRLFFKLHIVELSSGRNLEATWSVGRETSPMKCAADVSKTTQQELIQTLSPANRLLSVYPIPAQNNININYELEQASEIQVQLYNYTGRFMKTIHQGSGSQGINLVKINLGPLANGMYLIRFNTAGYSNTQKLVVNN